MATDWTPPPQGVNEFRESTAEEVAALQTRMWAAQWGVSEDEARARQRAQDDFTSLVDEIRVRHSAYFYAARWDSAARLGHIVMTDAVPRSLREELIGRAGPHGLDFSGWFTEEELRRETTFLVAEVKADHHAPPFSAGPLTDGRTLEVRSGTNCSAAADRYAQAAAHRLPGGRVPVVRQSRESQGDIRLGAHVSPGRETGRSPGYPQPDRS